MKLLQGIYQIATPHIVIEKHGGATLKNEIYWHLCLFKDGQIGMFGSGKGWYHPYFKKEILDLKGQIILQENKKVKGEIFNSFINENIIIEGIVLKDRLRLKAYNESTPNEIWLEDEFEYLDLDYEKLEKEFNAK